MPKIYPVIHHLNQTLTMSEADNILGTPGVDGVFLIYHGGNENTDWALLRYGQEIKRNFPNHQIGVNLLSAPDELGLLQEVYKAGLDMVWYDRLQTPEALNLLRRPWIPTVFTGVAFKGQKQEADPVAAAEAIRRFGFLPTTSGTDTGVPPTVEKIRQLSEDGAKILAVASGMTPENVAEYAPYLTHILVATGVSQDPYHVDTAKLRAFIQAAK